jgi:hypothetical protein
MILCKYPKRKMTNSYNLSLKLRFRRQFSKWNIIKHLVQMGFQPNFINEMIKEDLMTLFREFHQGDLPLFSLNFGTIILLPKCREATKIQQYRPICLLNMSIKIFTKVATNRVMKIA